MRPISPEIKFVSREKQLDSLEIDVQARKKQLYPQASEKPSIEPLSQGESPVNSMQYSRK